MVVFHIFKSNSQVNRWHRQPLCHSNASFGTWRKWRNQTGLKRGPSGCKAGPRHFRSVVSRSDAACAISSYNFRRTNLCSTNVQSWHLFASRNTAITSSLIRFLRSKNTGGIPPSPMHHRRDYFAPVTSPWWQGLFVGLRFRFNVNSSNAATVVKTNFVMASHSLARGYFAVHVRLRHKQQ